MSRAALATSHESPTESRTSHSSSSGIRVGEAHDTFEREAERVGEIVSSGGWVSRLSLSNMSVGQLHRTQAAEPEQRKGSGASMEDVFLSTGLGRKIASAYSREAAGFDADHEVERHGEEFRGPEAAAAVTELALHQGGLPARLPDIVLDRISAGLRAKIVFSGSARQPTQAKVVLTHSVLAAKHPALHKREELTVQRRADGHTLTASRADVESAINSPGQPLDPQTRTYMEARIGFDFGNVRVHTDAAAADSARAMGAQAYTLGNDVVFAAGTFCPGTQQGKRLIAHELTHVVQQRGAYTAKAHPVIRQAPAQIQRASDDNDADENQGHSSRLRDWLIRKVAPLARRIPGYELLTVILQTDLITGQHIERTAEKVINGVLELIPGGREMFENLKKSSALNNAFDWFMGEFQKLNFSYQYFKGLINQAWSSVGWSDFSDPSAALHRLEVIVAAPYERVKQLAADVFNKAFEMILEGVLSGLHALGILDVLKKAGALFGQIARHPGEFLGNLVKAVQQGFRQFGSRLLEHLREGLFEWLFGELAASGVRIPKTFDFLSIVGMVLQVLGLDYRSIRAQLVDLVGEKPVARLEGAAGLLHTMLVQGPGAAWEEIKKYASDLMDTVIANVRSWVITQVVTAAAEKFATLFVPGGAIIQVIETLYHAITYFFDRINQIAALANTVLDSVGEIAAGNVSQAANYIEQSITKIVPRVLEFLAGLLHLGGIGKAIGDVIGKVRDRIKAALKNVLTALADKARQIYGKGKEVIGKLFNWAATKAGFVDPEGHSHTVLVEEGTGTPQLMVRSTETPVLDFIETFWKSKDAAFQKNKAQQYAHAKTQAQEANKIIKAIDIAQRANAQDPSLAKRQQELLARNEAVAAALKALLGSAELKLEGYFDKYGLEGVVGRYGSMPKPVGDRFEADHQPQKAVLLAAAKMRCFDGTKNLRARAANEADDGFAINLYLQRHRAGRTWGSKGKGTLNEFLDKATVARNDPKVKGNPAAERKKVVELIGSFATADAEFMEVKVLPIDENWTDILKDGPGSAEEKKRQRELITARIKAGELQIKNQPIRELEV